MLLKGCTVMKKIAILAPLFTVSLFAAQTACPQFYLDGEAPDILNKNMSQKTKELCYEAFGVMHSGITKTPLWSAEILLRENLETKIPRKDFFHEETRLPANERAELKDYSRSGYDRGHMSPSADMPTPSAQAESFTLANMIPQDHVSNTGVWSSIESATRYLAKKEGRLHVITGALFVGNRVKAIGNNVLVPSMIYKVIYSPKQQKAAVYIVDNEPSSTYKVISVQEIEKYAGINFFPKMSEAQKANILELPVPQAKH